MAADALWRELKGKVAVMTTLAAATVSVAPADETCAAEASTSRVVARAVAS